jgi:hypothetical protein
MIETLTETISMSLAIHNKCLELQDRGFRLPA